MLKYNSELKSCWVTEMLLSSAVVLAGTSVVLLSSLPATAQIIPDNTLGNESSVVVPNVDINGINPVLMP